MTFLNAELRNISYKFPVFIVTQEHFAHKFEFFFVKKNPIFVYVYNTFF